MHLIQSHLNKGYTILELEEYLFFTNAIFLNLFQPRPHLHSYSRTSSSLTPSLLITPSLCLFHRIDRCTIETRLWSGGLWWSLQGTQSLLQQKDLKPWPSNQHRLVKLTSLLAVFPTLYLAIAGPLHVASVLVTKQRLLQPLLWLSAIKPIALTTSTRVPVHL